MFVISCLNVKDEIVNLINTVFETEEIAFKYIFEFVSNVDNNKFYINKIKNKRYIEVYSVNKGYFYNNKSLIYVYQILSINHNDNKK